MALLLLFLFAPEEHRFYPRCLLFSLTGLQCPGCGGLRAMHQLLHGHLREALALNPLLPLLLLIFGGLFVSYVIRLWTGRKLPNPLDRQLWIWVLLAVIFLFSVARNLGSGTW